ncbi:pre-mRNA-processing protein prp40 [Trichoderma asperellum]|uniref:Pre-mRNA-processing protein prp40 n=1 Tax=Trichoderma asperellum TaxID=101201 RepID=A0A6V8QJ47_TRIAP|nr:pre-mRNA-processing protein prp40 [Trichoderma asperellum]
MSSFAPPFPQPASAWQEHKTPEGRAYYYNNVTKVTQWTKPEEMMSLAERALQSQPWKEYTAEGGRKYWYNTETQQSSWEMPEAYKKALGSTGGPSNPVPQTPYSQGGGYPATGHEYSRDSRESRDTRDSREPYPESRQISYGNDSKAQPAFVPATNDLEYSSQEEAEAAFIKLLKRSGVQSDWNWEQTIRVIAKDPQFRAIRDPKERKEAFEKYCQDMILQDKERAKERLTKLRADFETMLKRHPEITHYTRWKTARPMIEGETIFRSTNDEDERRQLFEEYIIGLKKAHKEQQASQKKSAMDGLIELLPKLNLEAYTRWADAREIISSTPTLQENEKYQTLSQFDILTAFQNHMKGLERAFIENKQEEKSRKFRQERTARDAFKSLLDSLRKDGKINAGTKWSQIVPLIENDERYLNMVGQAGSTPQELFWDVVEEEERSLRGPKNDVLDVLEDKRFDLTPTSDLEEFLSIMKDDHRTANIDHDILKLIFDRLREKRASKREDDRQPDRQQRRAIDDLRAYIKRLEPPVALSDTYDKSSGEVPLRNISAGYARKMTPIVPIDATTGLPSKETSRDVKEIDLAAIVHIAAAGVVAGAAAAQNPMHMRQIGERQLLSASETIAIAYRLRHHAASAIVNVTENVTWTVRLALGAMTMRSMIASAETGKTRENDSIAVVLIEVRMTNSLMEMNAQQPLGVVVRKRKTTTLVGIPGIQRDSEEIVHVSAPPLVMDVTATGPQNQSQPRTFEAAAKKARLKSNRVGHYFIAPPF